MSVDSSFGKLPDHLLIEIFIRVPVSEWAQISCVKKQWANLFRGECLWQAALATTYPLANPAKRWPGPIPRGLSKRRFAALYVSKHIFSLDGEIDEIVGHTYLFLKEQLELSTMPPSSSILHGTIIDQFIACGKSRDMAHDLASQIWLAVLDNLEENEHTFQILKRLAQEGDNMDDTAGEITCIFVTKHHTNTTKGHSLLLPSVSSRREWPSEKLKVLCTMLDRSKKKLLVGQDTRLSPERPGISSVLVEGLPYDYGSRLSKQTCLLWAQGYMF
ncbi:lipid-binding serum glycoprotein family protein, partial [Prunus dulcis]